MASSHVKQEAVRLHEQINGLEDKRDNLLNEIRNKETPQVKFGGEGKGEDEMRKGERRKTQRHLVWRDRKVGW